MIEDKIKFPKKKNGDDAVQKLRSHHRFYSRFDLYPNDAKMAPYNNLYMFSSDCDDESYDSEAETSSEEEERRRQRKVRKKKERRMREKEKAEKRRIKMEKRKRKIRELAKCSGWSF